MLYEFTITDPYNHSQKEIITDALSIAQEEYDFLGIVGEPSVKLVSESMKGHKKVYSFIAELKTSTNSGQDSKEPSPSEPIQDDRFVASP